MEPQNSNRDYYLLSAHYLNKDYGPIKNEKETKEEITLCALNRKAR